ncbi:unnamed protein product [Caenorhabditis nigoni]
MTPKNQSGAKNKQDLRYLLQFVIISIFYTLAFILFEILPVVVPPGQIQWYALVPSMVILNCSSNAIIYLCLNRDVQNELNVKCFASGNVQVIHVSSQMKQGSQGNVLIVN